LNRAMAKIRPSGQDRATQSKYKGIGTKNTLVRSTEYTIGFSGVIGSTGKANMLWKSGKKSNVFSSGGGFSGKYSQKEEENSPISARTNKNPITATIGKTITVDHGGYSLAEQKNPIKLRDLCEENSRRILTNRIENKPKVTHKLGSIKNEGLIAKNSKKNTKGYASPRKMNYMNRFINEKLQKTTSNPKPATPGNLQTNLKLIHRDITNKLKAKKSIHATNNY
jgi:hypothetical protein